MAEPRGAPNGAPGHLRVATVGCGFFSQFHHEAWQRLPGAELVAVCDRDPARAGSFKERYGAQQAFADPDTMLDAVRPDLLDIITPPETHLALVELAAARGVDVICQKPLAPTLAMAERLVEAAEAAGIRLAVHENFRFQPWHREARRLLDVGRLGTPYNVSFRLRPGDGQGPDAYLARQPYFQRMPRFLIHETAIHLVDTFRFLMGEVVEVGALLRRLNLAIAGEDAGYLLFRFADGAAGLFDGNRLNDHVSDNPRRTMGEMWIEGSAGVLRLDGFGRLFWKPHGGPEAEHAYAWEDRAFGGDAVFATQAHILDHLRLGRPLEIGGRQYLRNIAIEEALYRAAEERRWLVV